MAREQEGSVFGLGRDLMDNQLGTWLAPTLWLGRHCTGAQRDVVSRLSPILGINFGFHFFALEIWSGSHG